MIFEDLNPPYFSIFQAETWKWKVSHFHLLFDEKCFKYSIGVIYQWNGHELLLPTKGFNKYSMNLYPSKSQLNLRFSFFKPRFFFLFQNFDRVFRTELSLTTKAPFTFQGLHSNILFFQLIYSIYFWQRSLYKYLHYIYS